MESTFVMIKPDGFSKKVFKEVMELFLKNGLSISNVVITKLDKELVDEHYSHLVGRDFYPHLQEYMLSGSVITMTVTGEDAISKVRSLIGATNPNKAAPGTVRFIYGDHEDTTKNVIHASDSVESAQTEIKRFHNFEVKKRIRKLEK